MAEPEAGEGRPDRARPRGFGGLRAQARARR